MGSPLRGMRASEETEADLPQSVQEFDDARDDAGYVGLRIDAIELCGFDERRKDRPVFSAPYDPARRLFFRVSAMGRDVTPFGSIAHLLRTSGGRCVFRYCRQTPGRFPP